MPHPERYAELRAAAKIRERPLLMVPRHFSEVELQARWFAGDFGRNFIGTAGEEIAIVQFGTWNHEAGPDFSDAVIRVDRDGLRRGSIEFDLAARNWETHGHGVNPAFEQTILHVVVAAGAREFFTRTVGHRHVPQVRVDPETLSLSSASSLPLARAGRCQAPLRNLPETNIESMLEAAAQFRLQHKAQRLRRLSELHGSDEALFQELAGALGYKHNKLPFTLIAQRLPLRNLRASPDETEALLFGVAGFLGPADKRRSKAGARNYLRTLWDHWWPHRSGLDRLILPPSTWRFSGSRPLNHPERRLGALAQIVANWPRFLRSLGKENLTDIRKFFLELQHPYWSCHYTLTSEPSRVKMALVGETRIAEIMANVVLPWRESRTGAAWASYVSLPARLTNRSLETGAARLFGDDPRRLRFLRTLAGQQGLLQIYEDFCLQDESDCAQCPFPEQMKKWNLNESLPANDGAAQCRSAFTLLELLIVISILSILMALLFPAFRAVEDQAKNTEAKNDLIQIINAVNAYYTEYGNYPLSDEAADATLDGRNENTNDLLFNKLRGQSLDLTANPKDIVFVSLPAAKDPSHPHSGLGTVVPTIGQFFDPWGTPFIVRLDTTFNSLVEPNPYQANAGAPSGVSGGVIAWSFGKDTKSESVPGPANDKKTGTNLDDVISWQ